MSMDEVGYGFGLEQVDPAVEKRASSELTRLGLAGAFTDEGLQDSAAAYAAAVALNFNGVFAGIAVRCLEYKEQRVIDMRFLIAWLMNGAVNKGSGAAGGIA